MLRALLEDGWSITCFSVNKNKDPWSVIRADIPHSVKVFRKGRARRLKFLLWRTRFAYDLVLVSRRPSLKQVGKVLKWLKARNRNCKIIYDFEALPALGERSRQLLGQGMTRADAEAKIREQVADVSWVDAVICNSAGDARELRRLGRPDATSVSYLDAPVPTQADFFERKDLLFVGRLVDDDSPNVDGLRWFVNEVWPTIVARLGSGTRLLVAGVTTAPSIRAIELESVQFLGPVRDLSGLYERARVFVAANRVSYGVPIKVLEAAAYGLPVATTDEVNSYMGWDNGAEILCGDAPAAFADACIRLYEDPILWRRVRAGALAKIDPRGNRQRLLDLVGRLVPPV